MPKGILNHDIWARAKRQVEGGKHYKDKWAVISHVYQQMGGKYHKSTRNEGDDVMGKSIEAIQNLSKVSTADMMRTITKQDHGESFNLDKGLSTQVGRKLGSAAAKVGSKLRRGARALSAAGHSHSARAAEYAGKKALSAGSTGIKHAGKLGAAAMGAAGLTGVAALGSGGKKTRKLQEANDIAKGVLARLAAHGSRALRGASGRIGGALQGAAVGGINRNMARRGMVGTAKQLRMGQVAELGRRMRMMSPTQSKNVMRGIANAPGKVARGVGRSIAGGPYGGTKAMLGGGATLAAGGLAGAYALRGLNRILGRRSHGEQARKAMLAEANDIAKGIMGTVARVASRGASKVGMGMGHGLTAIGAKKAGNFAFRHPKVAGAAAVGGAGALGIGAMSRRRKQQQNPAESQGQV